nr:hypothetical protein [Tanacetum cinerariifolium]
MMIEDPYVEVALQAPPSLDYMPGLEELEQAPPSPDYIPEDEEDDKMDVEADEEEEEEEHPASADSVVDMDEIYTRLDDEQTER